MLPVLNVTRLKNVHSPHDLGQGGFFRQTLTLSRALSLGGAALLAGCSAGSDDDGRPGSGGSSMTAGGSSSGGSSNGGAGGSTPGGGASNGGSTVTGGASGSTSGGSSTGGATTGGVGGAATGGAGAGAGGRMTGGTGGGGVSGAGGSNGGMASGGAGAGGSGGLAGGGIGGGSGGTTSKGCSGGAYKLCDDFETGTVGALPMDWTRFNGYGTASPNDAALASDQFRSGAKALKAISGTRGTSRAQRSLSSLGATASKHWGRVFYKVQQPHPILSSSVNSGFLHLTFTSLAQGSNENRIFDMVQNTSGKHQWLYNNPNDTGGKSTSYDYGFDDKWHCTEWYVDFATKSYRFFQDSMEITALAFTNKADSQMVQYDKIILGTTYYQSGNLTPPFTTWFDDLAIHDTQIGCQ